MARPKAFDTTDALETAMRVFWERGYEATSIQDLVDSLGVNRASLYGTFGDKAQLFEAAMKRYDAMMEAELAVHLKPPHAGREAVQGYLLALILRATEPNAPRGCLMLNTVVGCTTAPPALLARAAEAVRHSEALLYAALKRDGTLAARKDLHALARFFAAQAQGLVLLARTGARASSLREAANVALAALPASASASA